MATSTCKTFAGNLESSISSEVKEVKLQVAWVIRNFKLCASSGVEFLRGEKEFHSEEEYRNISCEFSLSFTDECGIQNASEVNQRHVMLKIFVRVPGCNSTIRCTSYFQNRGGVREKIGQEVAFVSFGFIDTAMTLEDILKEENKLLTNGHLTLFFDLHGMYLSFPKATTQTSSQILQSSFGTMPTSKAVPLFPQFGGSIILPQNATRATPESEFSDKMMISLERLVGNADYSDFTLVVEGKDIPVHKAILAVISPVFEAMFRHAEAKEVITDMTYEIACHLLRFIYAGKTPEKLSESAMELIIVADKYDIPELVKICEASLVQSLTVQSVPDLLILADRHQFPNLKKSAVDFIKQNLISVKATKAWARLSNDRPDLIIQYFV